MLGNFKFVLTKDIKLFIGFAHHDFHYDICGGLDVFQIRSAGYLHFGKISDEPEESWHPNGSSIGYRIGVRPDDQVFIKTRLKELGIEDIDVIDLMTTKSPHRAMIQL